MLLWTTWLHIPEESALQKVFYIKLLTYLLAELSPLELESKNNKLVKK
jgi:hypothetical protein